jgi:hypothetical protein
MMKNENLQVPEKRRMHELIELCGVGAGERARVLDSGNSPGDLDRLYAARDDLQMKSLALGELLPARRYAVRAK